MMMEQVYALLPTAMDTAKDLAGRGGRRCDGAGAPGHQVPVAGQHRHTGGGGIRRRLDGRISVGGKMELGHGDLSDKLRGRFDDLEPAAPEGWWEGGGEPEAFPWEPSLWYVIAEDAWAVHVRA